MNILNMNITDFDYSMSDKAYSIYVSGCKAEPKCKGCFNPENWDFNRGKEWTTYKDKISKDIEVNRNLVDKIIIVGGEPLDQNPLQLGLMLDFLKGFKIPIYLFTRYELKDVPQFVKDRCDFIKCGAYKPECSCESNEHYGINLATDNQKIYAKCVNY